MAFVATSMEFRKTCGYLHRFLVTCCRLGLRKWLYGTSERKKEKRKPAKAVQDSRSAGKRGLEIAGVSVLISVLIASKVDALK